MLNTSWCVGIICYIFSWCIALFKRICRIVNVGDSFYYIGKIENNNTDALEYTINNLTFNWTQAWLMSTTQPGLIFSLLCFSFTPLLLYVKNTIVYCSLGLVYNFFLFVLELNFVFCFYWLTLHWFFPALFLTFLPDRTIFKQSINIASITGKLAMNKSSRRRTLYVSLCRYASVG